jgi:hypothetical protein
MRRRKEHIELGYIDVPTDYFTLGEDVKKVLCNKLIDVLYENIDRDLDPEINRITFLDEVLESSIITNEQLEQYVICQVLLDCRKNLHED